MILRSIHPHRQSLNPEDWGTSWWVLIFSFFHKCYVRFQSGDWLGHSNTFIFFLWNHLRVFFVVCFGSLSCWKIHLCLILTVLVDRFFSRNLDSAGAVVGEAAPCRGAAAFRLHSRCDIFELCAEPFLLQTWCTIFLPKSLFHNIWRSL